MQDMQRKLGGAARRATLITAAAGITLLALTACTAPQTSAPTTDASSVVAVPSVEIGDRTVAEGGNLVFGLSGDPDTLDPTRSSTLYSRIVLQPVCERLYQLTPEGDVAPMLATELPTVSEDGLTVTFPVRQDAVFSDGTELDAAAVVRSLQRNVDDPRSARKSELGPISDIVAVDDSTVQITYATPFDPLLSALIAGAGVVQSPAALDLYGNDGIGEHPTCVGAFTLENRVAQTSITLVKNPLYYDADSIALDSITFQIMPDSSVRATNLQSGSVQVADVISTQDVDTLLAADGVGLLNQDSLGYQHLNVNLANNGPDGGDLPSSEPLAQLPEVREALSMSIDRQTLVDSVFGGWFQATCSGISPASGFATELSEECPAYDPASAKAMLEEAGVSIPFPLELHVPNFPDNVRMAQALQAMVKDGGFDMTVVPMDISTLNTDSINGEYVFEQQSWSGRLDPNGNLFNFLSTGGGINRTGYSNPEVDRMLTEAVTLSDKDARAQLYGQIMQQVRTDNPMIFLYRIRNLAGYSEKIAGIDLLIDGIVDVSRAAFVE